MNELVLDVMIDMYPHPLKRARSGGNGHHYDPAENVTAKTLMQYTYRWKDGPITDRVIIECGFLYMRKNPTADVDNLAKTVLDSMNGYVIKDDSQVQRLTSWKLGGQRHDQVHVRMWTLAQPFDPYSAMILAL